MPYCPKCGAEASEVTRFCPSCGQDLSATTVAAPQAARIPEQVEQRPTGVTILAILQILGGLLFLVLGGFALVIGGLLGMAGMVPDMPDMPEMFPLFLSGAAAIIGMIMIVIGILGFAVAYGYWNGLGWAWTLGLVVAVIGLVMGLTSLPSGIVGIIIDALIIYYLTRPHVKMYFGKKPIQVTV